MSRGGGFRQWSDTPSADPCDRKAALSSLPTAPLTCPQVCARALRKTGTGAKLYALGGPPPRELFSAAMLTHWTSAASESEAPT